MKKLVFFKKIFELEVIEKLKNSTESKSQNKITKINLEKHFNNNENNNINNTHTFKKTYQNFSDKIE